MTGPIGKIVGVALLALALFVAGMAAVHQHDARVRAEQLTAEQKAQIAAMQADHAHAIMALEADAEAARELVAKAQATKAAIHAAPASTGCVDRPAVRAAINGLRRTGSGTGSAGAGASVSINVPGPAGAPTGRR